MKKNNKIAITKSSGNVFADLGVKNPDQHLAKVKLAHQIMKIIQERHLNQAEAAEILGIDQPKISALNRGQISGFSIDRLFYFLALLDQDIEVTIKPHKFTKKMIDQASHLHVRCL